MTAISVFELHAITAVVTKPEQQIADACLWVWDPHDGNPVWCFGVFRNQDPRSLGQ
jgi:hypothetical protein